MAKLSPLEASERRLGFIMLLPAAILLAATVLYPIAALIRGSFSQNVLTEPGWRSRGSVSTITPRPSPTGASGNRPGTRSFMC